MTVFSEGQRVRVVIADPNDPDHRYCQKTGTIAAVCEDLLSTLTNDSYHDYRYRVEFEDENTGAMDFRYDDLERV